MASTPPLLMGAKGSLLSISSSWWERGKSKQRKSCQLAFVVWQCCKNDSAKVGNEVDGFSGMNSKDMAGYFFSRNLNTTGRVLQKHLRSRPGCFIMKRRKEGKKAVTINYSTKEPVPIYCTGQSFTGHKWGKGKRLLPSQQKTTYWLTYSSGGEKGRSCAFSDSFYPRFHSSFWGKGGVPCCAFPLWTEDQ